MLMDFCSRVPLTNSKVWSLVIGWKRKVCWPGAEAARPFCLAMYAVLAMKRRPRLES